MEAGLMPESHHDIVDLFLTEKETNGFLSVSAPMVRYSKLQFRQLVRKHDVKLCFTPMIVADSFNQSENARRNEFTTNQDDRPLIAQFAARSAAEFVTAAELIYPYVDGVDLNCGCPQSWAISKGYGCGLLKEPQTIFDIVRTLRRTVPEKFSCSIKIRLINEDIRTTVELARCLEHCGVTFLTVHGRTQWQKCSHPLNVAAMTEIKKSVRIPVVMNGNVRTFEEANALQKTTNGDGIMAARGLLANPALFDKKLSEVECTPQSCVQSWLNIAAAAGDDIGFQCFHHHLTFMWSKQINRSLRLQFNNFTRKDEVFRFFDSVYNLRPHFETSASNTNCIYSDFKTIQNVNDAIRGLNHCEPSNHGKYFLEFNENASSEIDSYDLGKSFFLNL